MFERYGNHGEHPSSYRESEKFKGGLTSLEQTSLLTDQAKVIILAVALGLKNAAEFEVYSTEVTDLKNTEVMLSQLGLFFYEDQASAEAMKGYNEFTDEELPFVRYLIGNTPETIGTAMQYASHPVQDHYAFGIAMDFPQTAASAFSGGEENLLSWKETNAKLTEEERKFLFFRLSKEHFEEEVAWLEQVIAAVKEYSPTIYREVMERQVAEVVD